MQEWRSAVWRSPEEVPTGIGPTVVTVGNFDGVHRGHRVVVDAAVARAQEDAREDAQRHPVVAVTFDPHPMQVLLPERAPTRLGTIEQRAALLHAAGVDAVLVLAFTPELAAWSPQEFVDRVLVRALGARAVVVGANFRFGARATGSTDTLSALGAERGFAVEAVPIAGAQHPWSSSSVRQCLAEGDVEAAAQTLGRDYTLTGAVVEGDKRGRELGYPTANVPTDGVTAVPADGVYAGWLGCAALRSQEPERWPAAISVGTNPTFDGVERRVESYVLDRTDLELYGHEVTVTFVARLRGQVTFADVDDLVVQMDRDVARTRLILGAPPARA